MALSIKENFLLLFDKTETLLQKMGELISIK